MKKSRLAKAITIALTGGALTVAGISSASASSTYYNTDKPIETDFSDPNHYSDEAGLGADGWTTTDQQYYTSSSTMNPWLGTTGGARPFGYTGYSAANWGAEITRVGDSLEISQNDAAARYGTSWDPNASSALVNIDTAKGAWYDGVSSGWGHNTDIGLFKSDVTAQITLNLTALFNADAPSPWSNFGVTVFTGMDTGNAYTHHYRWNDPTLGIPFTTSNPGGSTGVIYDGSIGISTPGAAYSSNVNNAQDFTFLAQAGQVYSIYLGGASGNGAATQFSPHAGYQLNISTSAVSAVPVPGAAWLFGTALAGVLGFNKRRLLTI